MDSTLEIFKLKYKELSYKISLNKQYQEVAVRRSGFYNTRHERGKYLFPIRINREMTENNIKQYIKIKLKREEIDKNKDKIEIDITNLDQDPKWIKVLCQEFRKSIKEKGKFTFKSLSLIKDRLNSTEDRGLADAIMKYPRSFKKITDMCTETVYISKYKFTLND